MTEKIVCNVCGKTYTDEASIQMAKTMAKSWEAQCREDGVKAKGLAPCPNIHCKGELVLQNS